MKTENFSTLSPLGFSSGIIVHKDNWIAFYFPQSQQIITNIMIKLEKLTYWGINVESNTECWEPHCVIFHYIFYMVNCSLPPEFRVFFLQDMKWSKLRVQKFLGEDPQTSVCAPLSVFKKNPTALVVPLAMPFWFTTFFPNCCNYLLWPHTDPTNYIA